ncbi:MAG TPA: response regulator [Bryobacteraceae bacterium]
MKDIAGEFGSNPNSAADLPSTSRSRDGSPDRYLIVLVEDNPADVFLVHEAIAAHHVPASLVVIRDGEEAIRLISRADADENAPCPQLFLLDLNIPNRNGEEVLAHIRKSARCKTTPVVIMTSSDSPRDRAAAQSLGANRYFRKPSDYDAFLTVGELIKEMLGSNQ